MKKSVLVVLLVTVALALAVAGSASASLQTCAYIDASHNVVAALGNGTPQLCAAFNNGFHGTPFIGHFGQLRCGFGDPNSGAVLAVLTRNAIYGRIFCQTMANTAQQIGWIRLR